MGHNHSRKLPTNLTDSQIELIQINSNMSKYEICKWYSEFYDFSNGKQLSQAQFMKYYKDLLPYKGNTGEFCKLIFNGKLF
jgi:hypothetical protein